MSLPTHISPADLGLIAKAQQGVAQAQDRLAFVGQHVTEVYGMGEKDTFSFQTGEISRAADTPVTE